MKNTSKIIAISASIMLGLGIILTIIGVIFGGVTSAYIDSKGIHFDDHERYEKTFKFDDIKDIDVSVAFSKVAIVKSDTNKVKVNVSKRYQPKVIEKNGKLIIDSDNNKGMLKVNISLFSFKVPESTITIYLKEPDKLNTVILKQSFGEMRVEQLKAKSLQAKNHFGDMSVTGSFEELSIHNNFGNTKINTSKIKELTSNNNFGDTKVRIDDNRSNYQIDKNSQFGDIEVIGNRYQNGTIENNQINLKNNFGDTEIEFLK